MAVAFKAGTGVFDNNLPLTPTYPAGGAANDMNILTVINKNNGNQNPNAPSGWTQIGYMYWEVPDISIYKFARIGNFSGSETITFNNNPTSAAAHIMTYT